MNFLNIILEKNKITIMLLRNKVIVDSLDLTDTKNSSKILLANIDLILKKNHTQKNQIKSISVGNNIPESYTSNRIAKSLEKSFNFALKSK